MSQFRIHPVKTIVFIITGILLILLPYYVGQYTVTTFIRIIYFGFLSLSMGFLIGQGGMVSLTQTAFFGLSGYIIGLFGVERGIMFPWPDLMAIGAVVIMALLFGMIAMRTHKIVFLMITLAFGQVCWAFAAQNTTILRGWSGIRGIRPFIIYGINFNEYQNFYWASLIIFALGIFILWRVSQSPFGLALRGIRENPRRMAAIGFPVYWIRVVAFIIAAVYAGLGGILAAYNTGIIMPTTIQLSRTIWVLLTVILGGASYFFGPIVGTFVAVWLDVLISGVTERYILVLGVIFLIIVLFSPKGILGIFDQIRKDKKFNSIKKFISQKIGKPD
jgi:branched-chain amino acid transport system permease protein